MFDLDDLGADDALEPVKDDACPKPFQGVAHFDRSRRLTASWYPSAYPNRSIRRLAVSIPKRVNELLSQETHRGGAQNDDALLMQPDDALIGPEVEQCRG